VEVKHMSVAFDPRSSLSADDRLIFRSISDALKESCFSGNSFAKSQDSESLIFAGNELTASFDCEVEDEDQKLWGYKFTVSGFTVAASVRQSIDGISSNLNSLFQDLLMTVCSDDDRFLFPPEILESDELVVETSLVLSKLLTDDVRVRNALELIFLDEFSGKNVSTRSIYLFQQIIKFAFMNDGTKSLGSACGQCKNGHICNMINGMPLEAHYAGSGWSCDICKKCMPQAQAGVWHCSICQFDVCPSCQPGLLETQMSSDFSVRDTVHLVPPHIADYRSFSDAAQGTFSITSYRCN
jgi:hypothetical protein